MVFIFRAGYPNQAAAMRAIATLVSATITTVTPSGTSTFSSATIAAAPLPATSEANA